MAEVENEPVYEPDKPRREVALEDLTYDVDEAAFMAALPEVAKQLRIANLLAVVQMLGPGKSITRDKYLDEALTLLSGS